MIKAAKKRGVRLKVAAVARDARGEFQFHIETSAIPGNNDSKNGLVVQLHNDVDKTRAFPPKSGCWVDFLIDEKTTRRSARAAIK